MIDKKKIQEVFSGFVDKSSIDRILEKPSEMVDAKEEVISFILVQVRENTANTLQTISKAVDIMLDADCLVEGTFSTFIFATFRSKSVPEVNHLENCGRIADMMIQELKCDIRVVYGSTEGLFGSIGTRKLMQYGSFLPGMGRFMEILMKIEYGKSECVIDCTPGNDLKGPEKQTP